MSKNNKKSIVHEVYNRLFKAELEKNPLESEGVAEATAEAVKQVDNEIEEAEAEKEAAIEELEAQLAAAVAEKEAKEAEFEALKAEKEEVVAENVGLKDTNAKAEAILERFSNLDRVGKPSATVKAKKETASVTGAVFNKKG